MTTEEKINQLQAQIDELRKEVKPTLEVGKWYLYENKILLYIEKFNDIDITGYGFASNGTWHDSSRWIDNWIDKIKLFRPATDKEVEEALIKEAERRGFKEGTIIKSFYTWTVRKIQKYEYKNGDLRMCGEFEEIGDKDVYNGNLPIFANGNWLETIKDEPIKVGGYEVKKDSRYINIGCKKMLWVEIKYIADFMSENNFKKVAFDGIEVDLETIEKILKM